MEREKAKRWHFHTTCVNSDYESISALRDAAKRITYRTLRDHLGHALVEVERELGYKTGHERGGLRMCTDWAVSYYRSTYQGKPCLYFVWSSIEHIFLQE